MKEVIERIKREVRLFDELPANTACGLSAAAVENVMRMRGQKPFDGLRECMIAAGSAWNPLWGVQTRVITVCAACKLKPHIRHSRRFAKDNLWLCICQCGNSGVGYTAPAAYDAWEVVNRTRKI